MTWGCGTHAAGVTFICKGRGGGSEGRRHCLMICNNPKYTYPRTVLFLSAMQTVQVHTYRLHCIRSVLPGALVKGEHTYN